MNNKKVVYYIKHTLHQTVKKINIFVDFMDVQNILSEYTVGCNSSEVSTTAKIICTIYK